MICLHLTEKQTVWFKQSLSVLFLTGMVFISEKTRQPAVLFPEILALLTGMWITPRMPWKVKRWEIPVLMTLCAVWGILISRSLPAPTAVKMGIAFLGAAAALLLTRSTLLPILSACILPILIGEQSWVYPIAVAVMTVLLALGQALLERFGLRSPQPSARWDWSACDERMRWSVLIPVTTGIAAIAIAFGCPCVVAPPLIVLLSELSFTDSPVAEKGLKVALVTILCACVGAACRWGLQMQLGLPLWSAALVASAGALTVFSALRLPFPPAGALSILPMLLPPALIPTYPLQVAVGTVLFILTAKLVRTILIPKKGDAKHAATHISAR